MRLALIDLSSIFWSSWHATAGQDIDAAARVSLERVQERREGFDAVVVCCDVGRTWRHDLYPQYKANRPPRDAAAYDQLRRVREQLESDGVPVVFGEGFEADDVIATLAVKAPAAGYDVVIHSADKDLCQLVGPTVTVQSTSNGGTVYDAAKVEEKFRVKPSQLGDFLALVGDKSDNVTGCPGCGEVNAARLLNELGSLANMLEVPDGITPTKMREAIVTNKQQILMARKLVQLRTDVPLDFAECIKPRPSKKVIDAEFEEVPAGDPEESPVAATGPVTGKAEGAPAPASDKPAGGASPGNGGGPAVSTALALVLEKSDPRWAVMLEPRNMAQLVWLAKQLEASQLYRKFPNSNAIMAAIMKGRSLGLDAITALDVVNVVDGKPTLGAMAIVGRCLASGKAEYFDMLETEKTYAVWETKRTGRPPTRLKFDIDEAEARGLCRPSKRTGAPSQYVTQPRTMLRKQCAVELARAVYPDVAANMFDPEELEPR
jgi:5'-3' exonuclease